MHSKKLFVLNPATHGVFEPNNEGNSSAKSAPMRSAILRGPFSWCGSDPERWRTNWLTKRSRHGLEKPTRRGIPASQISMPGRRN